MEKHTDISRWIYEMAAFDSESAFESLYLVYFPRLIRFAGIYVSASEEAEEVVSDAFLAVWDNRKSLPGIGNFDAYIYTVVRYKAVSYYRSRAVRRIEWNEKQVELFSATETTPEEELISKELAEQLDAAIDRLPGKCKIAFKLVREDKLKYKDAAAILDISVKTLESHLAVAVRKLRETLKNGKK